MDLGQLVQFPPRQDAEQSDGPRTFPGQVRPEIRQRQELLAAAAAILADHRRISAKQHAAEADVLEFHGVGVRRQTGGQLVESAAAAIIRGRLPRPRRPVREPTVHLGLDVVRLPPVVIGETSELPRHADGRQIAINRRVEIALLLQSDPAEDDKPRQSPNVKIPSAILAVNSDVYAVVAPAGRECLGDGFLIEINPGDMRGRERTPLVPRRLFLIVGTFGLFAECLEIDEVFVRQLVEAIEPSVPTASAGDRIPPTGIPRRLPVSGRRGRAARP